MHICQGGIRCPVYNYDRVRTAHQRINVEIFLNPREFIPYGRYKGYRYEEIPTSYIKWAVMNIGNVKLNQRFEQELRRRGK